MSKLTEIIRREVKDLVSKQGGLMVTPAVVTAVQEDFLRADVKLLGNGAEIKGMLNKSPGKLTVGQTVTVAYETLPSSGVILIANGETDPLSEGGGWDVESAVLYDAANLHEYTVDTTLITDISANTKLYYGASGRMIVAQGMIFYHGSILLNNKNFTNALDNLLTENSAYIAPEYRGIISYKYENNIAYRVETDVKVYLNQVTYPVSTSNTRAGISFSLATITKTTNLSTSVTTTTTNSVSVGTQFDNLSDVTEYGLVLVSDRFGEYSPVTQLEQYIPNGYVGVNSTSSSSGVMAMLVFKNDNASVNKWNARYDGTIMPTGGNMTYRSIKVGYVMPISANETILALGATKRTEPQGGDD